MYLQVVVLEKECRDLGFENFVKNVSPKYFEMVARTHAKVPYSFSRQMVVHYEEVERSKTLENIVELERPTFSDIVARPLTSWLLYSFLTQIFLQMVVLERECRNLGFRKIVKIVVRTHARVPQSIPRWMFDHLNR